MRTAQIGPDLRLGTIASDNLIEGDGVKEGCIIQV